MSSNFLTKSKYIGLYFSAHWCPPCRAFTPNLVKFYNEVNIKNKQIEIIFVSCDKEEKKFKEYFASMPWLTLPFQDERIGTLADAYECQGIPYLVILKPDGTLVTNKGREDVTNSGSGAIKKWEHDFIY